MTKQNTKDQKVENEGLEFNFKLEKGEAFKWEKFEEFCSNLSEKMIKTDSFRTEQIDGLKIELDNGKSIHDYNYYSYIGNSFTFYYDGKIKLYLKRDMEGCFGGEEVRLSDVYDEEVLSLNVNSLFKKLEELIQKYNSVVRDIKKENQKIDRVIDNFDVGTM